MPLAFPTNRCDQRWGCVMRYILIFLLLGINPAEAKCYKWAEARDIIPGKGLIAGTDAFKALKKSKPKDVEISKLELCHKNGQYYYRARTMNSNNKVKTIFMGATMGGR